MKAKRALSALLTMLVLLQCLCLLPAFSEEGEYTPDCPQELYSPPEDDNARVFYEIFTGSFSDSNGDGIGDLRGIINRMDYLNDGDPLSGKSLGIEGIWLTPIFKSKTYHKYDVDDYYTIDPSFGTMEDLRELIDLCHERNVKLILDLPINHTGTGVSWYSEFVKAHRQKDKDSPYYDFYTHFDEGEARPAGRAFSQISGTKDYVECNFSGSMPELNFDSELVRSTVLEIARYYLDMGIDGFRFDAAKYIYYGDNGVCVDFWAEYIGKLKDIKPDIYIIAEVWDGDGVTDMYFPAMNCFNFTASGSSGLIADTAAEGDVNRYTGYVSSYLSRIEGLNSDAMLVPFIANHDMDRAAGFVNVSSGRMQMAANLYLLGPGSPFIYYGEEIGMKGSRGGADTDADRRLAMLWGDGDTVADPVGSSYPASKQSNGTVAAQLSNPSSLYNYYKKLLMIRAANPEIARGEYTALQIKDSKLGGFISDWNGSRAAVLHNTTGESITVELSAIGCGGFDTLADFIGAGSASLENGSLTIEGRTSVILR